VGRNEVVLVALGLFAMLVLDELEEEVVDGITPLEVEVAMTGLEDDATVGLAEESTA
jgi:hypothetical protein